MGDTSTDRKRDRIATRNAQAAAQWAEWIESRVRDDVLRLHQQRVIFDGMQNVVAENPDIPRVSVLWEYQFDTYTVSQAVAVRRLAETGENSKSLAKLLEKIGVGDREVTRSWWVSGRATNWDRLDDGNQWFDRLAGEGVDAFPAQRALDDLDTLTKSAVKVKDFVDRYLAHVDGRGLNPDAAPSLKELHENVDLIRALYVRYSELLTRWDNARRELELDISNWRDPLKLAWIEYSASEGDT